MYNTEGVAHDGADAKDTVEGVVDGICRINVDGGENCITAEHLVRGVVVVSLVVAAELLEVGGKVDNGKLGVGKCAGADGQLKSLSAVGEADGGESVDLECVRTNSGQSGGEACACQLGALKGGSANGGKSLVEEECGHLGVLEGAVSDALQGSICGNIDGQSCRADIRECERADACDLCGNIDRGKLGLFEHTVSACCIGSTDGKRSCAVGKGYRGQSGDVVERAVTDGGHARGNRDGSKLCIGKRSVADGSYVGGNGEGSDRCSCEGLVADEGNRTGQAYGAKLIAALERAVANLFELVGLCCVKAYRGKVDAVCKGLVADLGDVCTDDQSLYVLVVLEYAVGDLNDSVPRKLGKIAVKSHRIVSQLKVVRSADLVEENAVLCVEACVALCNLNGLNGEASVEDRAVKACHGGGKLDGLEDRASAEYGVAEGCGLLALTEGEGNELGAACECRVTDGLGGGVCSELLKGYALFEGVSADGLESCGLVNVDRAEERCVLEGAISEGCNVNAGTDGYGGQGAAVLECRSADGDLTCGLGGRACKLNCLNGRALECGVSDGKSAVSRALDHNGGQVVAAVEGVIADYINVCGNNHGGYRGRVFEEVGADSLYTCGSFELTREGAGDIKDRNTCGVGVAKEVADSRVGGAALFDYDVSKSGQGVEAGHIAVEGSNERGQLEGAYLGQVVECGVVDGNCDLSVICELNGLELRAVIERILGKVRDVLRDHDLGDACAVEGEGTDGGNLIGNGILAGLGYGEYFKVMVVGCLIVVKQSAVEGGVELLVRAGSACVNVECLKVVTSVKCADSDVCDGVGEGDGLESVAVLEAVLKDLGNGNAHVGRGDLDLCGAVDLGTCLDTVGSVCLHYVGEQIGLGIEEGIYLDVLCEAVRLDALSVRSCDQLACACGSGVPTLEEADGIILGLSLGKSELGIEDNGLGAAVFNVADHIGIDLKGDVVLIGDPISEEGQACVAVEHGIGKFLTVGRGRAGNVIPAAEGVACVLKVGRQVECIAESNVLGDITGQGSGHIGDLVCGHLKRYPLGIVKIGATYLDGVDSGLGEDNGSGVCALDGEGLAAVYSDLKVLAAENGSPGNGIGLVGQGLVHHEIAEANSGAVSGGLAVCNGAYLCFVNSADGEIDVGILHIEAVGGDSKGLITDLDLILLGTGVRPAEDHAVGGKTRGSGGSGLVAARLCGGGGNVAVGYGSDLDRELAGVVGQREGIGKYGEGVAAVLVGQLDLVLCGVLNEVPNEGIDSVIVNNSGDGIQLLLIGEDLGDRVGIAVCGGCNGKLDTAVLHGAV